jgi:hypothetical protein
MLQPYTFVPNNPLLAPLLERVNTTTTTATVTTSDDGQVEVAEAEAEAAVAECFEEGVRLFELGKISQAVANFEAAIQFVAQRGQQQKQEQQQRQQNQQQGRVGVESVDVEDDVGAASQPSVAECWRMLGACHQESDEDRKAIVCLENAVNGDP